MSTDLLTFQQLASPSDVTAQLRHALAECWVEVTNAGGAAGFPFPLASLGRAMLGRAPVLPRLRPRENSLAVHSGLALLVPGRAGGGRHVLDRDPGRGPAGTCG